MARINLVLGILLGIAATFGGPMASGSVRNMFNAQLMEKAVPTPGPALPDGTPGRTTLEVSPIDRAADAVRWQDYQKGIQSISIYSLALVGLGLLGTPGKGQLLGGIGFGLGTLLYGGGLALGAYFNMPTIGVLAPIGAMILLAGWGGLLLAAIQGQGEKPMPVTVPE